MPEITVDRILYYHIKSIPIIRVLSDNALI